MVDTPGGEVMPEIERGRDVFLLLMGGCVGWIACMVTMFISDVLINFGSGKFGDRK